MIYCKPLSHGRMVREERGLPEGTSSSCRPGTTSPLLTHSCFCTNYSGLEFQTRVFTLYFIVFALPRTLHVDFKIILNSERTNTDLRTVHSTNFSNASIWGLLIIGKNVSIHGPNNGFFLSMLSEEDTTYCC